MRRRNPSKRRRDPGLMGSLGGKRESEQMLYDEIFDELRGRFAKIGLKASENFSSATFQKVTKRVVNDLLKYIRKDIKWQSYAKRYSY